MKNRKPNPAFVCPFCDHPNWLGDHCDHFQGWTNDGKMIERDNVMLREIVKDDVIRKTGVSARVWREKLLLT